MPVDIRWVSQNARRMDKSRQTDPTAGFAPALLQLYRNRRFPYCAPATKLQTRPSPRAHSTEIGGHAARRASLREPSTRTPRIARRSRYVRGLASRLAAPKRWRLRLRRASRSRRRHLRPVRPTRPAAEPSISVLCAAGARGRYRRSRRRPTRRKSRVPFRAAADTRLVPALLA